MKKKYYSKTMLEKVSRIDDKSSDLEKNGLKNKNKPTSTLFIGKLQNIEVRRLIVKVS